jgi:hypothetical protein
MGSEALCFYTDLCKYMTDCNAYTQNNTKVPYKYRGACGSVVGWGHWIFQLT